MPYEVPTVADFRDRFPEFDPDTFPDKKVSVLLGEAARSVDKEWIEADYQPAILYLTAHLLETFELYSASYGMGGIPKQISFGNRSITFDTSALTGGSNQASYEYDFTIYGQMYLRLLHRNVVPVLVTNAY